jgi:hypothetical protein
MSCKQGCRLQGLHSFPVNLEFLRNFDGVDANPLQVVVSSLILGLNGKREYLDRSHMQVGHLFHMPLLVFQFAEVKTVGTVDEIHHRKRQQRRLPVGKAVQPAHHAPATPAPTR